MTDVDAPRRTLAFETDEIRGVLHQPAGAAHGLVLSHGAGSDHGAPLLRAVADAFAAAGVAVLRVDLAFRRARPKGPPPRGAGAADRAGLRAAVEAMREVVAGAVYLGGHSYGGRQASLLAAEDPAVARALLLLSYPLHPPKQPETLRTDHFAALRTPAVFVHGPADPFATAEELAAAAALIRAPTTVVTVPGAGHDLKGGRFDLAPVVAALLG